MGKSLQTYLDDAVKVLDTFGLKKATEENSQLALMVQDLATVDQSKAIAVARVVEHSDQYNALVRREVEGTNVEQRYLSITEAFDSIVSDSKRLVSQLDDGKVDWKEKAQNAWMKLTRGDIPGRFEDIKDTYQEVAKDMNVQIESEDRILEGYRDFRGALKHAGIAAQELLSNQEQRRVRAQENMQAAQAKLDNYDGDVVGRERLELARDEAIRSFDDEDSRYQLAKDVAEDLAISYNVGEVVMSKLKQTRDIKEAVYRRAVSFFTTQEHVFTAMSAAYNSALGLHEGAQTVEALKAGANKSLEGLADITGKIEEKALDAAYGPTILAESVQKLTDAVVSFQEGMYHEIERLREESAQNTQEISAVVNDGKRRIQNAIANYARGESRLENA